MALGVTRLKDPMPRPAGHFLFDSANHQQQSRQNAFRKLGLAFLELDQRINKKGGTLLQGAGLLHRVGYGLAIFNKSLSVFTPLSGRKWAKR